MRSGMGEEVKGEGKKGEQKGEKTCFHNVPKLSCSPVIVKLTNGALHTLKQMVNHLVKCLARSPDRRSKLT